jgi:hypothetical protein
MLIEFSVGNFRSIREQQTLSMLASPRLRKRENTFKPNVDGEKFPALLRVAAIYGPNASGKSNLLKALDTVRAFTRRQPSAEQIPLPVTPFRFDPALRDKPSKFELHFVQNRRRYSFFLAATENRITEERLIEYPFGEERLLYSRAHDGVSEKYDFGETLEGDKKLHETWKQLTGPQVLFITQAVANSNEEFNQLRVPWSWLSEGSWLLSGGLQLLVKATQSLTVRTPSFGEDIATLLSEVDIPVSSLTTESKNDPHNGIAATGLLGSSGQHFDPLRNDLLAKFETKLTHSSALGDATFSLKEESDGTRNLLGFALPWFLLNSPVPTQLQLLIVDELDSSLHPKIVVSLVSRFLRVEHAAQLIFTTHDTHLMDAKVLRRDQFWVTERDQNGSTQLRSIHDFDGRDSEDIEKRYYEGRYRGLPLLRGVQ